MNSPTRIISPTTKSSLSSLNTALKSDKFADSKYFILVDSNTFQYCLPLLISRVSSLQESQFLELPIGEKCKDLKIATQIWQTLLESNADRNTVIINLGGGCISDLGGFVAAGFKRGIRYINIPTTLIGMVDASIGGKTAVNLGHSKNQVGFFHNPAITCIEPAFLNTLPPSEWKNGIYEIVKTQILTGNQSFLDNPNQSVINQALLRECIHFKQSVVKADPEEHNIRKILNFGHTFGHAVESYSHTSKKPLSHGHAVGIGIKCALYLSSKKMGMDKALYEKYSQWLAQTLTTPKYTLQDTECILHYMLQDKKNANETIQCVLLQDFGIPVIDVAVTSNEARDTLLNL